MFEVRIKRAICRGARQHESLEDLIAELRLCELFLRSSRDSLSDLERGPVIGELDDAMQVHAEEDSVVFDEVCAANVVLASMNALTAAKERGDL